MDRAQLEQDINAAWEARDTINAETTGAVRDSVMAALGMLDSGDARVAEPMGDHQWHVNQWLKKAVLLSFRLNDMAVIPSGTSYAGSGEAVWWDKVPRNLPDGTKRVSAVPVSVPCLDVLFVIPPISVQGRF